MKDGARSSALGRGRIRAFWGNPVDVRPLALMRITFGLVLLMATLDIAPVLFDLLSEDGVLPRSALFGVARLDRFSVMDLAGPRWVSALMLALAVLAVLSFTVGFHTRAATIACFVFVTGIHERNLAVFDGADNVIRVVLFWLMFTPAGAHYSVDAVLKSARGEPRARTADPFAVRLLQIQFSWIYFASVLAKLSGTAWPRGTALHYALSLEHLFTRPLGLMLSRVPHLSTIGTYFTLGVEGAFLFLVFSPFLQPFAKALALLLGAGLHLGIALTMNVGSFSYLMIACYPLLFEGAWAERAVAVFRRRLGRAPPAASAAPLWEPPPQRRGLGSRVLLGALLVSALWFSIPQSARRHVPAQPRWLFATVQFTELWQVWDMFAPDPVGYDFYLRSVGKLKDGTEVDVLHGLHGGPLPPPLPGLFFTRWTKFITNLAYSGPPQLLPFGSFLCRRWNADPARPPLVTFKVFREQVKLDPVGAPKQPWEEHLIWDHHCF
jgi:hypothetical protein